MRITIKRANQADIQVVADLDITVAEFKEQISTRVALAAHHIRLVCEGRVWEDSLPLSHYGVTEDRLVHCLRYMSQAQTQPVVAAQASGEADWMQHIMNSPSVQQLMNNPQMMRSLLRMNPEMNELLERQPEMARLLEDPEILQQSLNAMRNPAMMREMMRQADRSMSNLETIPGGMDALRRMHTEFSDPLYEAMHGSRDGNVSSTPQQYNQRTDGPMNASPVPNPWANATASTSANPNTAGSDGLGDIGALVGQMYANRQAQGASASATQFPPNTFVGPWGAQPWGRTPWSAGSQHGPNPFMGFSNVSSVSHEPQEDEVRLKIRYKTQTHLVVCKKSDVVATLKCRLELLVQVRRQHIRLVQAGQVWQDINVINSYAPARDCEVFALKYVPPGQTDLGAPVPAMRVINPFLPTPEIRFTSQLDTLADMGFTDRQICIQTLLSVDGDVTRALDILLGGGH